jgi:hypothetical protein
MWDAAPESWDVPILAQFAFKVSREPGERRVDQRIGCLCD